MEELYVFHGWQQQCRFSFSRRRKNKTDWPIRATNELVERFVSSATFYIFSLICHRFWWQKSLNLWAQRQKNSHLIFEQNRSLISTYTYTNKYTRHLVIFPSWTNSKDDSIIHTYLWSVRVILRFCPISNQCSNPIHLGTQNHINCPLVFTWKGKYRNIVIIGFLLFWYFYTISSNWQKYSEG